MEKRQEIQHKLAFEDAGRGEAPRSSEGRVETTTAGLSMESQADTSKLIEEVLETENLKEALRRVKANAGAPGVEGMTVSQLPDYLRENWLRIKEQLLAALPRWTDSYNRRYCRFCRNAGTPHSASTATGSGRGDRHIRRWRRRKNISKQATAGS